jgi:hypothetical protein
VKETETHKQPAPEVTRAEREGIMNLNSLYKMIKEEKIHLSRAKELQVKFPDVLNPQTLEYVENYLNRLIKEYKAMGGKRHV